ncbi:histidinol-phosphatase HisJ family protein [Thermoanaerobacterium sp. DL9XJH110]|uniref:histidinol-phosphatase HisJ family protein n=1 Tax=Thermoanaerobacterium sp. DL9XJH110 TaxID=3386643 RepID=UPI003BB7CFD8
MQYRDYHVHLERGPYTVEWMKRFLDEGRKKGVIEIGFSEHGHRFVQAGDIYRSSGYRGRWAASEATEDIEEYIDIVEKAKSLGFPVKLGIEMDYIPEYEEEIREFVNRYPFDYVLGAVHWLGDFGFDNPDLFDEWERRDVDRTYEEYFDVLLKAVRSGIFDCIAHPDVIKVFGHRARRDMGGIYAEVARALKEKDICAEVSTAGLRKPAGELYPSPLMMEYFKEYDVQLLINSDAHEPEDVGRDFDKALEFLKGYGYDRLFYFHRRKKMVSRLSEVEV